MTTPQQIIDAVMNLPVDDQFVVMGTLLEKLSPPPGPEITDVELYEELERRRKDRESGRSTPIPWEQVRKDVFAGRHGAGQN